MKRIVPVVLVVAASMIFAAAAQANRNRDATLEVSTSTALVADSLASGLVVGDDLVFSGCGYAPRVGVTVAVLSPTYYTFFGARAGDDGCFRTSGSAGADAAGDYTAWTWQSSSKRPDAELDFVVSP